MLIIILALIIIPFFADPPSSSKALTPEKKTDFNKPLFTTRETLVCPLSVAFDVREGSGLKGAMEAHAKVIGHDDAVAKSGCQEWREGLPISLSDEGKRNAIEWQSKGMCGMADFGEQFIFSCDLRN